MALTDAQMLAALHKKNPKTLNRRYTSSELKAAYDKQVRGAAETTSAGTTGTTGTTDPGTTTGETTDPGTSSIPDPLSQENIDRFNRTVELGKGFGNGLIDDLGLRGEFLGRIDEGPGADYYADLAKVRELSANAGNLSALDEEALANARLGLGGLDSAENAAIRSRAVQGIDQQFGQQRQQLLRYQGGMGSALQRAAQISDLGSKRVGAQRELERDILVENIQQKKDARLAFSNLTNSVGARQDSRVQNLAGLLQSGNQFADTMKMQGQQFNTGTQAQEYAARTGALVGGIGTTMSTLGGYQAEEFQNRALEEALKAKREEIEATKQLTQETLNAQQNIFKHLAGQV